MTRTTADSLLLVSALIWGFALVCQKTAMAHLGPFIFTGARFSLAAVAVLPFALREQKRGPAITLARTGSLAAIGLVFFLSIIIQQFGFVRTTVTNAGFLLVLYVVMVPVLTVVARRGRVHPTVWLASACRSAERSCSASTSLAASIKSTDSSLSRPSSVRCRFWA
jgi:drug/metabolite transporter (DMT)-like permease